MFYDHLKNKYPNINKSLLIFLQNIYQTILPCSWIVLDTLSQGSLLYMVSDKSDITLAEFLANFKVTALTPNRFDNTPIAVDNPDKKYAWGARDPIINENSPTLRETTVFAQSEILDIADQKPICEQYMYDKSTNMKTVILDGVIDGLKIGQRISITGTTRENPSNEESEIAIIDDIELHHNKYQTKITLRQALSNDYVLNTVKINANIVQATHGETKKEIIGSGNPSESGPYDIILKQKLPLTYVSAPTSNGVQVTLQIHINNILWKQVHSLSDLKHDDRGYLFRVDGERYQTCYIW